MKTALLIAFDFPPYESSGVERTFKFARYLRKFGWNAIVLTVEESTYDQRRLNSNQDYSDITIFRTFCLDISKHLAYKGKYFGWMKQPDRYIGWLFTAFPKGIKIAKEHKPDVIWSTSPILTSHAIAGLLAKWTKIPWVADYRDPLQCHYDPMLYKGSGFARWIDRQTVKHATKIVCVTEPASELYQRIHNTEPSEKFVTIANGFDSKNMASIEKKPQSENQPYTLFHAGSLYETERNPQALFEAIALLKSKRAINAKGFCLALYGAHNQSSYQPMVNELLIDDLVKFMPQQPYKKCLKLMLEADMLVAVQGEVFKYQIPGKIYEYLWTAKPILALTPKKGSTFKLVDSLEGCLGSENVNEIASFIEKEMLNKQHYQRNFDNFERLARTEDLANLFDQIVEG